MLLLAAGCAWISQGERDRRWDLDRDGVERPADCDDDDPNVFPGAVEQCDAGNVDEDCDGAADNDDPSVAGARAWCADPDADGFGDPTTSVTACDPPAGFVADCGGCTDCTDTADTTPPGDTGDTAHTVDTIDTIDTVPPTAETGDGPPETGDTGQPPGPTGDTGEPPGPTGDTGEPPGPTGDTGEPPGPTGDTGDAGCDGPPDAQLSAPLTAEVGAAVTFDASASTGFEPTYRFGWGDGALDSLTTEPTIDHTFADVGYFHVTVQVEDDCGSDWAEVWIAVAGPGSTLTVTTALDENDLETAPPWLGAGLSLREAVKVANATAAVEVVTFDPAITSVSIGATVVEPSDPGGIVVGPGVEVTGTTARIHVTGTDAIVAGLVITGLTNTQGALHLDGVGAMGHHVAVRDAGSVGVRLSDTNAILLDSEVSGSTADQIQLQAPAIVEGCAVSGGDGVGISIEAAADGSAVRRSRVWDNGSHGVELARDADDIAIVDSTIVGNSEDGIAVDAMRVDRLDVRNLILAYNGGWGISGTPVTYKIGSPNFDLWFANLGGTCESCPAGLGAASMLADPQLGGWTNGDLTPSDTSPVIDAGTGATNVDRTGPLGGNFLGTAPDIGAIEVR